MDEEIEEGSWCEIVVGSMNYKVGDIVRIVEIHRIGGQPVRYYTQKLLDMYPNKRGWISKFNMKLININDIFIPRIKLIKDEK